jgi:negative regulator of replication initiation
MYTKDKSNRITLRLNDEQFCFVKAQADLLGVSPSEFLRMVVNASLATSKSASQKIQTKLEGKGRENDEANINDSV